MRRLIMLAFLLIAAMTLLANPVFTAVTNGQNNGGVTGGSGNSAVLPEYTWNPSIGAFQVANIHLIQETDEIQDDIGGMLSRSSPDAPIGEEKPYTYWDGEKWNTIPDVKRYEASDVRLEAYLRRFDETTFTPAGQIGDRSGASANPGDMQISKDENQDIFPVPAAFTPRAEVILQNGWKLEIEGKYLSGEKRVTITPPNGRSPFVFGGSLFAKEVVFEDQDKSAPVGEYLVEMDGFTLLMNSETSAAGLSFITNLKLEGPNGYTLVYGRDNEVIVSGGTR